MSSGGAEEVADRNARIADYVLAQLDEDAAARFEWDMAHDPALAREVHSLREVLVELDADAPTLAATEPLWTRIVADAGRAQPAGAPARQNAGRHTSVWSSLAFWRNTGLAATAATLVSLAGIITLLITDADEPVLVAVLVNEGGMRPGAVVEIDRGGVARLIALADIPVPAGRALQVWTLQDRQVGPRSVGLIPEARSIALDIGDLPPARADQLFEITLEPEGGSPTGRPTGPILFKGTTNPAL